MKLGYTILVMTAVTIWIAIWLLPDSRLHVVFCDVGQGDAILISRGTDQLLVDGGPNDGVIRCLADHMPFFDRRIEAVVLSHDDSDHSRGLSFVRERYSSLYFEPKLTRGDEVKLGGFRFSVIWPQKEVLGDRTVGSENSEAVVARVTYGDFDVLLTADTPTKNYQPQKDIEVVKVPHHGSRIDFDLEWWFSARPELAVISVGKNSYGHPAGEVIGGLGDLGIKVLRTDREGDIEIVSDGQRWWVK